MNYEYRYVRVDGTAKVVLLVLGALIAPFALLTLPPGELTAGDLVAWVVVLGMLGALAGTIVGYAIDSLIRRFRTRSG